MRFVSIRDLRNQPGRIKELIKGREAILTSNGKPVAILVGVEEDCLEETLALLRRARALAAASRMRAVAADMGSSRLTPGEIDEEVAASRGERITG